jgi:hypothetical protein
MPVFIQPSFSKGEIAPSLFGRVDLATYRVALATARNVNIATRGGALNRPGSQFIGPVRDHTLPPHLIPFQFNADDQYVLEFGAFYMRVIRNDAHVLETVSATITGATQANPVVVTTSPAHGYVDGDEVVITGVAGMTELNNKRYVINNSTATTFELTDQVTLLDVDGSGFTAYTSGGDAARIYEIATPYAQSELSLIKHVQSADVMTLTHPDHAPRDLSRFADDNWTLTEVSFAPALSHPTNLSLTVNTTGTETIRYSVSAIAVDTLEESLVGSETASFTITGITQADPGVVTTSAVHGLVDGDHVILDNVVGMTEVNGNRYSVNVLTTTTFELQEIEDNFTGIDTTGFTAYSSAGDVRTLFVKATNSAVATDNTITWSTAAGVAKYRIYREKGGRFGFIGESETATFTDDNIDPDFTITPPQGRNPFEGTGNFPAVSTYYQQRQVYAGSTNNPDTTWFSKAGSRLNFSFSTPFQADDSITTTLTARDVNEIRWIVPTKDLLVFSEAGEWLITFDEASGLSPDSIVLRPQSSWGSAELEPIVAGSDVLYVDNSQSRVRNFRFSLQEDKHIGDDITVMTPHFFEDGVIITDWAYTTAPDNRVHAVLSDGQMIVLTFNAPQQIAAWSTWDTNGKYEAITVLRKATSANEDGIYTVVKRVINGNVVRYIEKQGSRDFLDVRDAYFVDCGLSLDAPIAITDVTLGATTTITAPSHGLTNGDEVDIHDIEWLPDRDAVDNLTQPDQINRRRYTVAGATTNTFTIAEDSTGFNAYFDGGTVRKTATTLAGLDHLEGETLSILADGNVITSLVVTNGSVTLPNPASRVHAGLKYVSDIETLNAEPPQGTIQGRKKKISKVTVRFDKSRGLLAGPNEFDLTEMKQREFEPLGSPTDLLTGDKEITLLPSWNSEGRLYLRQRDPLPMTILAVVPDLQVGNDT